MPKTKVKGDAPGGFQWAVPKELGIPPDKLRARLDFYHQAVTLNIFDEEIVSTRVVSAMDVAHALANDLAFGTGLLPQGTLFWRNTKSGPVFAIYEEPRIRKVALSTGMDKPPKRFTLPMPGLIFLCSPGKAPWVYAVKKRPAKEQDEIFNAPLCNIYADGRSCPGNNKYPTRAADIVQSFFTSFFTAAAGLDKRSQMFPRDILQLWKFLDKKRDFPLDDLVKIGTLKDLLIMEMR